VHTITFYSYKGGVGRSLVVANIARYLSKFRQRVFAIDLDLEAPGLHYKFALDEEAGFQINLGVVDYIHEVAVEGRVPKELVPYTVQLHAAEQSEGPVWLMPAGSAPSPGYWERLARLNWHELFYDEAAKGIALFLELKELIRQQFEPDFLLIDSRTGITEIGGVATTVLPDQVVCLFMNNRENLEGAREVLRSIRVAPRPPKARPVEILPVLTRIPVAEKPETEEQLTGDIQRFLNEQASDLAATLNVEQIAVLHSEPDLELAEALRIGGRKSAQESPLLRDYVRLFHRLIPREVVDPHIGSLVAGALQKAFDAPDSAEKDLQAIVAYYPHPEAYRALLKLYRLRRDGEGVLRAAWRLSELTAATDEPIMWEAVRDHFVRVSKSRREGWDQRNKPLPCPREFIEAVWRAAGANDVPVGLELAQSFTAVQQAARAATVLHTLLNTKGLDEAVVVRYLSTLTGLKRWQEGLELIESAKSSLEGSSEFAVAWAEFVLAEGNPLEAARFLDTDQRVVFDRIREEAPSTAARILLAAGRLKDAEPILDSLFEHGLTAGTHQIYQVGQTFAEAGRREDFEKRLRSRLGDQEAERILQELRHFYRW
jgi:hypothetical protein